MLIPLLLSFQVLSEYRIAGDFPSTIAVFMDAEKA